MHYNVYRNQIRDKDRVLVKNSAEFWPRHHFGAGRDLRLRRLEVAPSLRPVVGDIGHPVGEELAAILGLAEPLALHGVLHIGHRATRVPAGERLPHDVDIVVVAIWNGIFL